LPADLFHIVIGQQDFLLALDKTDEIIIQDIVRHDSAEFAIPPENDNRMHTAAVYPEAPGQHLGMQVVLSQRILETVSLFIQYLCPVAVTRSAEYPAVFIFRFYHENAVPGNDHVVNPGGSQACVD